MTLSRTALTFFLSFLISFSALGEVFAEDASERARAPKGLKFGDSDPVTWVGRAPSRYAIHGLDVARFQNDINWRQVRAAGISFAFIKATEGGDLLDPKFKENWRKSGRAGLPRGAYHFYYFS